LAHRLENHRTVVKELVANRGRTAESQSGAASQHKISAKRVWRTALKSTGRLLENLLLTEAELLKVRLVLLRSIK